MHKELCFHFETEHNRSIQTKGKNMNITQSENQKTLDTMYAAQNTMLANYYSLETEDEKANMLAVIQTLGNAITQMENFAINQSR